LTFTPATNGNGAAIITVTVNDGGTSNNIVTRTFTVTVNAVNNQPTLNAISNLTINENAGLQTVSLSGIGSGAANESQTLTVTAVSSNTGLIPNPTVNYTSANSTGSLTFTPVANGNGAATITVTVNDGGTSNNIITRTFTVTVNAVNNQPTLNAISNLTINENAGLQTVSLSGIGSGAANESQTLTVTAVSSNTGLIPNPTVNYTSANSTGSLTFTPATNGNGTATITVTVNDGGTSNNIITRTFTVTVNAVNNQPTLNAISNLTINENAGLQTVNLSGITSGATNENQTLTVTAVSISAGLISKPTVNYTSANSTGSLTFTPVVNKTGTATITVTVNDGGASNNIVTQTFTVTVNAVNQPPTILEQSNIYAAVVCTNLFRFKTNTLSFGEKIVTPLPPTYTNFVFTGFWLHYSPLGVWTLQSSSNLLTWGNYATVTNAVFIPNTGGNWYFRLKSP
jgi:azurin